MIYTLKEIQERVAPLLESIAFRLCTCLAPTQEGRRGRKAIWIFGGYDWNGLTSLLKLGMLYCDLEAAFEKEIDIITVGAIMQEPAMPSDMDFKNTILNERVQLHDVA